MAEHNYYNVVNASGGELNVTVNGQKINVQSNGEQVSGYSFESGDSVELVVNGYKLDTLKFPDGVYSWSTLVFNHLDLVNVFPANASIGMFTY